MTRKQKGLVVLTSEGVVTEYLPKDKYNKEEYFAEAFCKFYSEKYKNILNIHTRTESPDFICSKNETKISLELCELVYESQLIIDDKYIAIKKFFENSIKIPEGILLEIFNFNVDPKSIPNIKTKKGLKILNLFIEEVKDKLYQSSRIKDGTWEYYVWRFNRTHFEFRISKITENLPFYQGVNFNLELAGIHTIDTNVHRDLLTNLVAKKERIEYVNKPSDSYLWLLIYSYRHFPLGSNDESVIELKNKLSETKTKFTEIWYFWPSPGGGGILNQLHP